MKSNTSLPVLRFVPLLILAILVNILAQVVHETGHLMVFQVMRQEPVWAFTKVVQMSEPPANPSGWVEITNPDGSSNWLKVGSMPTGKTERAIMAAAGPLLGLLSAVLGLVAFRRKVKATSKQVWLAYALTISLVAVLYYLRSPMRTGGDEYDIAANLGITKTFVEISLALGYLACLVLGLREFSAWKVRFKWLGTILLGSIASGLPMALLDPIIITQVEAGNPWFQPVIGYSLPVFITIILTFLGIWAWSRWQARSGSRPKDLAG